jgi:excisionase family DNA binding protein
LEQVSNQVAAAPPLESVSTRISIAEIADRLAIGRRSVYALLEQRIIPGIRLGQRWLVTRHAYAQWERTCGMHSTDGSIEPGLPPKAEVRVN